MAKRESFELAFFTISDTVWIGGLGAEPKNGFVLVLILMDSGLLPQAEADYSARGQ